MKLIELVDVKKKFGDRNVVNGITFSIDKGEVFGLLGPNGAGKTTTLSMMSAQLSPDEGQIRVSDYSVGQDMNRIKSLVGIVPQEIALYPVLSARDNLQFFGSLYGMKKKPLKEKINWILDLIGLAERANEPIKNYSGGMKRRVNIAAALLHDPLVLFMDEPTVGIDPQSRNKIYELIRLLKQQGMTIVYTTHYMEEATALCDRVAIVDRGEILQQGTISELIELVSGGIVELSMESPDTAERVVNLLLSDLNVSFMIQGHVRHDNKLTLIVKETQGALKVVMDLFAEHHIKVTTMNIMPPTLETVFLYLTGKYLRD